VANNDHSSCVYCPAGTVRGLPDGTGTGDATLGSPEGCLPGSTVCKVYQRAAGGKCVGCPSGQVANDDFSSCEYCPAGTVRGNVNGDGLTGCSPCELWQRASGGRCVDCPSGQVANDGATSCVYCPAGFVRGVDGLVKSDPVCVPAAMVCTSDQRGAGGKCVDCPNGQVANQDYSSCVYS
jgi:hypothetical protein